MARPKLAVAAFAMCVATALAAAPAQAEKHDRGACTAARSAGDPHSATRSFHASHCSKGPKHRRHHRGKASHLLYFSAVDGHCRDAAMAPSTYDVAQVRAATLCLVNRERAAHGERPLRWNDRLVAAAQSHTESMAFDGYFNHVGPAGETPLSRMRRVGYIYSSHIGFEVGENIAWGSLWLGTPNSVVAAWMASPGHRANILDANYRETGIGVSPHLGALDPSQAGGIYTQDFGVIVTG